jgi:lysophospholipase L1-like esterase
VYAVGGWSTADVLPQAAAMLSAAEHYQHVDLVIVALGTNDATGSIPAAEARYAKLLATILEITPPTTKVALTFIGYSIPPASVALTAGEQQVNNMAYRCGAARNWTAGTVTDPRFAGWIDWQSVPATGLSADGIHPNGAGYNLMGDLAFGGVQARMGWSAPASPHPTTT